MARKAARRQRQLASSSAADGETDLSQNLSITLTVQASPMPGPGHRLPLLVCSIGNPTVQHADTLHSAGHTVLRALHRILSARRAAAHAPFVRDKALGAALVSRPAAAGGSDWTLWQSPSYMNLSGAGVAQALRRWGAERSDSMASAGQRERVRRLVVLHDDLESGLGAVSVRGGGTGKGGQSFRGHNGLKDIARALGAGSNAEFWRIGVGIGRPESRDSEVVGRYVTSKMTAEQKEKIEDAAEEVLECLERIAEQG